jgi:hypothetical protein
VETVGKMNILSIYLEKIPKEKSAAPNSIRMPIGIFFGRLQEVGGI